MISKIKKFGFVALLVFLGMYSVDAQDASMWKIDKSHTSINFSINHFFSAVTGKFTDFDGSVHFDPQNLKGSKARFTIAVNSVDTDSEKRDKHLHSKDFFNTDAYPTMSFVSTSFTKKSKNQYLIYGKLTLKDKTKDVVLPMKVTGEIEHPMMKGTMILGVQITTSINRTDFGVGTGDWAATMVVGDEVTINIPMELNRKK